MLTYYLIVFVVSTSLAIAENKTTNEEGEINFTLKKLLERVEEKSEGKVKKNLNIIADGPGDNLDLNQSSNWKDVLMIDANPELIETYSKDNLKSINDRLNNVYGILQNISEKYNRIGSYSEDSLKSIKDKLNNNYGMLQEILENCDIGTYSENGLQEISVKYDRIGTYCDDNLKSINDRLDIIYDKLENISEIYKHIGTYSEVRLKSIKTKLDKIYGMLQNFSKNYNRIGTYSEDSLKNIIDMLDDNYGMLQNISDNYNRIEIYSEDCLKSIKNKLDNILDMLQNNSENNNIGTYSKDILKSIKDKLDNIYDRIESRDISNDEVCKRMVGLSKSPYCQYNEEKHLTNVRILKKRIPMSCRELLKIGRSKSGIYEIHPNNIVDPFMVFCDMETMGGGWTVIQKRFDGSEDFYRDWRDYKFGFGNLNGEYWIGLEHMYQITTFVSSELLVEITLRNKTKRYAHYNRFGVGSEVDGYPLNVLEGFSGDAGDSLITHLNRKFSTKDMYQEPYNGTINCAEFFRGAWWYEKCFRSSLNGKFINLDLPLTHLHRAQGIEWFSIKEYSSHAGSRMMVRPV